MRRPTGSTARPGRRGLVAVAALVAAGVLAAGCSSGSSGSTPGRPQPGGGASGSASGGTASGGSASAGSASAGSPGSAGSGGGTVTSGPAGGPITPGEPACAGWPAGAPTASLPVSFVPVQVERCVDGAQTVPGKGLWQTATLQRADSGLSGLISALRQPSVKPDPRLICPALAEIPPDVVLVNAAGQQLIPRLPTTGCGLIQSPVLLALNSLHWQTVSVRLLDQITAPASTVPGTPHTGRSGGTGS